MSEKEKPPTANDIDMSDGDKTFHQRNCDMLGKHETLWIGRLGHRNVAEHAKDLNDKAGPFKSASYRSGPTAWKLESSELKRTL